MTVNCRSTLRESAIITAVGGAIIFLMARKAFDAFFYGENFSYLQLYYTHNSDFWRGFFSPINGIFFRPIVYAFQLPWHFLLPPSPLAFHIRNFGAILLILFLLHRVLCQITYSRIARISGCAFFVVSKIHLTLIGLIGSTDTLVLSSLMLLTVLFFLRFTRSRSKWDYIWTLVFCTLAIFSKDYGIVVCAVLLPIAAIYGFDRSNTTRDLRWWSWRFLPIFSIAIVYFSLRLVIVGSIISAPSSAKVGSIANYAPRFSISEIAQKIPLFLSTLFNMSFVDDGSTGGTGLPHWIQAISQSPNVSMSNALYFSACMALFCAFLWCGRTGGFKLLFPLIWIVAYLGPTLLIHGVNAYYHFEPMIGIAVLIALIADASNPRFALPCLLPLLTLIGVSGALSNQEPRYHWSHISAQLVSLKGAVIERYRDVSLLSITFAAPDERQVFWRFALADPMLQELTKNHQLQVRYTTYTDVAYRRVSADSQNLILDADNGFTPLSPGTKSDPTIPDNPGPPVIVSVSPNSTSAGQPFNLQPNGVSAFSIECRNASTKTVVYWNKTPLQTAYANSSLVTALIPKELYAQPGTYVISIVNAPISSNCTNFIVLPQ